MAQQPVIRIWEGSSSFTAGSTPFGYYDNDTAFINDADRVAKWVANRLGYPITDVELQPENFYAAFEEAVSQYGTLINTFNIRDNLLSLSGLPTGSTNLTGQYIQPTLRGALQIAKQYATEVGAGGNLSYYTGSFDMVAGQQVYEFKKGPVNLETGSFETDVFTIRRIFHERPPLPGTAYASLGNQQLLNQFGWGDYSYGYTLMPLETDLLRMQAIEIYESVRRSAYSFELTGNRLRIFPIPKYDDKLFFTYTLDDEILDPIQNSTGVGSISDYSNIPYANIIYSQINDPGKNWIRRYTLSLCKEMLGMIRSKYSALPIPDQEIQLNGESLMQQAQTEIEALLTEMRETLDSMSRQAQLERQSAESDALGNQMNRIPLMIYVK